MTKTLISHSDSLNKKVWILCSIICIILMSTGCKKFIDISPPKTEFSSETTFDDITTANAAITGIYSQMINDNSAPYYFSYFLGLSADELVNYSTQPEVIGFYQNELTDQNSYVSLIFWNPAYKYIYQANAAIEGLSASTKLPIDVKNQLLGEAKFIRSFWYFYLVNLFGEVPLILTSEYKENSTANRRPTVEVYQQIIADLQSAETLMKTDYVGVDGITSSFERIRANQWAAKSLLARVYLYTRMFPNAESLSSEIIDNTTLFQLEANIDNVFLKNSLETIWALQPLVSSGFNTPEGQNFILTRSPRTGTSRSSVLSDQLLVAFDSGDYRRSQWVGTFNTFNYPYKYKIGSSTDLLEYSVVLRLSEIYLIRAEARAEQGKLDEALDDLNAVHTRSNQPPIVVDSSVTVIDAIMKERQIELFTEWGHRWLDLKRTGRVDSVMNITLPVKGGSWSTYKQLFPIPKVDRDNNSNLTQNSGY